MRALVATFNGIMKSYARFIMSFYETLKLVMDSAHYFDKTVEEMFIFEE